MTPEIPARALETMAVLQRAVDVATEHQEIYVQGVLAGMGIDADKVDKIDIATGEITLRAEDESS